MTVSGEKIIGYVDSVKQFEYDASAAGGKVGRACHNAVALFDNVTVYSGVVGPEENERANPFEFEEAATVWNNEDKTYQESTGTWSSVTRHRLEWFQCADSGERERRLVELSAGDRQFQAGILSSGGRLRGDQHHGADAEWDVEIHHSGRDG